MASTCAWRRNGSPAYAGPVKRPQGYAGTDRQIRGALMAVLRDSDGPVGRTTLDLAWPDATRRATALASLLADGLACEVAPGVFALAGDDASAYDDA